MMKATINGLTVNLTISASIKADSISAYNTFDKPNRRTDESFESKGLDISARAVLDVKADAVDETLDEIIKHLTETASESIDSSIKEQLSEATHTEDNYNSDEEATTRFAISGVIASEDIDDTIRDIENELGLYGITVLELSKHNLSVDNLYLIDAIVEPLHGAIVPSEEYECDCVDALHKIKDKLNIDFRGMVVEK